ncbi:tetratricopeptide repeat-containing sensor histidine kinase [Terrimonas pollutisoli]|uniref:tetratricopeptide repeat-containing sensor histidine kinase n=1 Tax=Terrimonas pollutisoli TaxID=3034147 RepID=UPI0023EBD525|nr:histidine kinase [Terrimonas sp. H1YJ31]
MKFLQFIGLLILQSFFCIICLAQKEIDSLKKLLPLTQDSAKVDCLNALGCWYGNSTDSLNWDTAIIYINQADQEAVRINYTKGIADVLFNRGFMEMNKHHYQTSERYFRKSIPYLEKARDKPSLGGTHHILGYILYVQGDFDKAIAEFQTSIHFFQQPSPEWDGKEIIKSLEFLSVIYGLKGELEKGFELAQKGLAESQQKNDSLGMAFPLMIIGDLYLSMGDYPMALEYYYSSAAMGGNEDIYLSNQMAAAHNAMQQYDSALYYHQKALVRDPANNYAHIILGEIYLQQKKYKEALLIFKKAALFLKKNNGRKELLRVFPDIAKVYMAQGNYPASLYYTKEGLALAQETGARQYIANGFKMLATIYEKMGVSQKSHQYLKQYIMLEDSLLSDQFKAKLFGYKSVVQNEKKQAQIERLNKEKQISLQQLKIQQQHLQRASLLKKILIGGILAFVLLGIILFRNLILKQRNEKLKSERTQAILQHKTVELEMQALRAQMNPHFIFNCLSSINRFILKNESEPASDYLTKFSRLIRMVLTNSKKTFITLEDELETLRLYLEMERLRFGYAFDFNISFKNEIDPEHIFIPPLLLQPFAENAIWHGLMHKQDQGRLEIELSLNEKILACIITDNGIGRSKAAIIKSKSTEKQKSMGLQITTERLALLNHDSNVRTFFSIQDLTDDNGEPAGTQVILKIHYRDMVEAPVEL